MFIQFWRCSYTVHTLFIHFTVHSGARPRSAMTTAEISCLLMVCCILPVKTVLSGSDCWFWQRKRAVKERRGTSDHLVKVSSPENQMETNERLDNRTSVCDDDDDNDTTNAAKGKEVWNE